MGKYILVLLFAFCLSCYAFGQVKDVEGWNKARWGMTEGEVLKVFEGKAEVTKEKKIIIDEIEIGWNKYEVNFFFDDKDKKLVGIRVNAKDKNPTEAQFSSLEQMLTDFRISRQMLTS